MHKQVLYFLQWGLHFKSSSLAVNMLEVEKCALYFLFVLITGLLQNNLKWLLLSIAGLEKVTNSDLPSVAQQFGTAQEYAGRNTAWSGFNHVTGITQSQATRWGRTVAAASTPNQTKIIGHHKEKCWQHQIKHESGKGRFKEREWVCWIERGRDGEQYLITITKLRNRWRTQKGKGDKRKE